MTTAWVIMTAMPPTKGHANLIRFAASLGMPRLKVIVCTQPSEPYAYERYAAVARFITEELVGSQSIIQPIWLNKEVEQDPSAEGFWEFWDETITDYGFVPGDIWVTSEPYGQTLADRLGGKFMPYDPNRELTTCSHKWGASAGVKATAIRQDPWKHFDEIMPQFQPFIRKTITVFGAESTGKTTLSKELAASELINGHWIFEWARPYLKTVGKEITTEKMVNIWHGQAATQEHAKMFVDKPFIIQDTDLYSTIGYWEQPHWREALGPVPEGLIMDAKRLQSDLYVITRSNIPFEQDDIRYGIDKRESSDEFWIDIANKYGLNYVVLDGSKLFDRYGHAVQEIKRLFSKEHGLEYDRRGL